MRGLVLARGWGGLEDAGKAVSHGLYIPKWVTSVSIKLLFKKYKSKPQIRMPAVKNKTDRCKRW